MHTSRHLPSFLESTHGCVLGAQGGSVGIMVLATVASLGSTAVFTIDKHNMLLTRAATAAAFDDRERHEGLSHLHEESLMDLKAV